MQTNTDDTTGDFVAVVVDDDDDANAVDVEGATKLILFLVESIIDVVNATQLGIVYAVVNSSIATMVVFEVIVAVVEVNPALSNLIIVGERGVKRNNMNS